jgi:hypothetical protein
MPATAAVLEDVRAFEQKMGIDELVEYAVSHTRFVTALDGKIVGDTGPDHEKECSAGMNDDPKIP